MSKVKAWGTTRNERVKQPLRIGFAGPCPPSKFDDDLAIRLIVKAFDRVVLDYPNRSYALVSGRTNVGSLRLAYAEAARRGWWTVGVASERAKEHPLFNVDEVIEDPAWTEWGSESDRFVAESDILIALGDGEQTLREIAACEALDKRVYPIDIPVFRG